MLDKRKLRMKYDKVSLSPMKYSILCGQINGLGLNSLHVGHFWCVSLKQIKSEYKIFENGLEQIKYLR